MYYNKFPTSRGRQMAWCFTLQRDSTTVKSIKLHTQTQSKGLNFYFEIAMCNKSHVENMLIYCPVLA